MYLRRQLQCLGKCHYLAGSYNKTRQVSSNKLGDISNTFPTCLQIRLLSLLSGRSIKRKWRPSIINIHSITISICLYTNLELLPIPLGSTQTDSWYLLNWIIKFYQLIVNSQQSSLSSGPAYQAIFINPIVYYNEVTILFILLSEASLTHRQNTLKTKPIRWRKIVLRKIKLRS